MDPPTQHVRAILALLVVYSGPTCEGTAWSRARLLSLQAAVVVGFIAFLRKSEILAVRPRHATFSQTTCWFYLVTELGLIESSHTLG